MILIFTSIHVYVCSKYIFASAADAAAKHDFLLSTAVVPQGLIVGWYMPILLFSIILFISFKNIYF